MAEAVKELLKLKGANLLSSFDEQSNKPSFEGIRIGIRIFTLEKDDVGTITHLIQWRFNGLSGKVLVTMRGRSSLSLRRNLSGHLNRD
jgi:hypothetical protein